MEKSMQALIYHRYGDASVMQLEEVTLPAPGAGEVLVKVIRASLNPVDFKFRNGMMKLLRKPTLPCTTGKDFAGEISALGAGVTQFKVGQRVFGSSDSLSGRGSCAGFLLSRVDLVAALHQSTSFETGACLGVAAGSALQALTTVAALKKGQRLLVVGASGSVGAAAVQIAHAMGAHVTGVCGTSNLAYVKSIRADSVVDYKSTDWTQLPDKFDVILDTGGTHVAWQKAQSRLVDGGVYVDTFPNGTRFLNHFVSSFTSKERCQAFMLKTNPALLEGLADWAAKGVLQPRVAERVNLDGAVAALSRMEAGKVQGKVVVEIA